MREKYGTLFLLATWLFGVSVRAAQCCGSVGANLGETELWGLRYSLCANPPAYQIPAHGFLVSTEVRVHTALKTTFSFFARDKEERQTYSHCWEATENLIEQCFRRGYTAGSWEWDGETYDMSTPMGIQYKRDAIAVQDLPTLPPTVVGTLKDIDLTDGVYNIMGIPVTIQVSGIRNLDSRSFPSTRGRNSFRANSGDIITNFTTLYEQTVDLNATISALVRDLAQIGSSTSLKLARRAQQCETKQAYAMVEYGRYWADWVPKSDPILCGGSADCESGSVSAVTTTESFSVTVDAGLMSVIGGAAVSIGKSWEKSFLAQEERKCHWDEGRCHMVWHQQGMAFQDGFLVEGEREPDPSVPRIKLNVRLVHSESPLNTFITNCEIGCCGKGLDRVGAQKWDACKAAAGKECWYGVCSQSDENCHNASNEC